MDTGRNRIAYRLTWELDHLEQYDGLYDAELTRFPDWDNVYTQFWRPNPIVINHSISFTAQNPLMNLLDYPYTDVGWIVVSKRMLTVLQSVQNFPHQLVPVEVLGDNEPLEDRQFSVLQLLEQLDVFNQAQSVYENEHENRPGRYMGISDYALDVPAEGFPPIFRIHANPTELFVSGAARDALEAAGIVGPAFELLEATGRTPEVDVAVPTLPMADRYREN